MRALLVLTIAALAAAAYSPAEPRADQPVDLADAVALADDPEQLALTWDRGFVAIPAPAFGPQGKALFGMIGETATKERLAALPADLRLPVIVYLHGCTGLELTAAQLPLLAERAGFAVVAPDSFARELRPKNCDDATHSGGMFPAAWLYRRAELIHAVRRASELAWFDPQRVVLAGFSEGAIAVALWGAEVDVAGYIVLGWTCTAPQGWWLRGLRTPTERPVLTIVSKDDPWFAWPGWQGDCGSVADGHNSVTSIVLDHTAHEVLNYPEAQEALVEFLRRWSE